ncbi:MAG: OsmC family protein [Candidatus Bathyarchaeia archaeon]
MSVGVEYSGGFKFLLRSRGHEVVSDQPSSSGGRDEGMTPPELLAGALGACIGVYVARFCRRHGVSTHGLRINVSWRVDEPSERICEMEARILLPGLDDKFRSTLLRVAESCLIHRTIRNPPQVKISLES